MRAEGYTPRRQADPEELGDASASLGAVSTSPRGLYQESPVPAAQEDDREQASVVDSCALSLASDFSCMRVKPTGPGSAKTGDWERTVTPSQADEVTSMKLRSAGQRGTCSASAGLSASQDGRSRESSKESSREQARRICSAIADSQLESTACSSTTRQSPTAESSKRSMCTLALGRSAASLCSDGTLFTGGYDDHVVQGLSAVCVPYRIKPEEANAGNLFPLRRYPEVRQDAKLHEILVGARIAKSVLPFPKARSWENVAWIIPFLLVVCAAAASSSIYVGRDIKNLELLACHQISKVLMAGVSGMAASFATAGCLLSLVRRWPSSTAWSVLLAGPGLTTVCGIGFVVLSAKQEGCDVSTLAAAVLGVALIVAHLLPALFVLLYRKSGVDFTGRLLQVAVNAVLDERGVLAVPILVAALGGAWSLMMCVTLRGLYRDLEGHVHEDNHGIQYAIYGLTVLVLLWGLKFLGLASHVVYCGLCGRCYFGNGPSAHRRLLLSLSVPVTTSLGTVCLASFCCSLVGSVELLLRQMSRERQEDEGNSVCCLLWHLAECITSVLGDAMEYCNEWALVQVAVRGLDFQAAVRVTARMMICSNMQYATRDLLLDALLLAAALTCSAVAAGVGMALGLVLGHSAESSLTCATSALLAGGLAGRASIAIVAGGGKTLLALWAEDPNPCRALHSAFHNELHEHIAEMYIRDGSGVALGSSTPHTTGTPSSSVAP